MASTAPPSPPESPEAPEGAAPRGPATSPSRPPRRPGEGLSRAALLTRERGGRGGGGFEEVSHIPQAVTLAHQVGVLRGTVVRLLQLGHLVAEKFYLPRARLGRSSKLRELAPVVLDAAPQLSPGGLCPQRPLLPAAGGGHGVAG